MITPKSRALRYVDQNVTQSATNNKIMTTALACVTELDSKTIVEDTLIAGHEEIKLLLTGKLPYCCLDFSAMEGSMQVAGRESPHSSYTAMNTELQQGFVWEIFSWI